MQDDLRLRPNLTFSPGLRYEVQTHVRDLSGFCAAPRPDVGARQERPHDHANELRPLLQLARASNIYAQTLRSNGFRQQEINIVNPTYPDIGGAGTVSATNKYLLGDLKMERIDRFAPRSIARCHRRCAPA